jgi:hypothetical protein
MQCARDIEVIFPIKDAASAALMLVKADCLHTAGIINEAEKQYVHSRARTFLDHATPKTHPFWNLVRLTTPLSDWQLQFYKFIVNVVLKSILALSEPVPLGPAFKTLLVMATRAGQDTRQRVRLRETNMRARWTKNRDQGHVNAGGGTRHSRAYRLGKLLANANLAID